MRHVYLVWGEDGGADMLRGVFGSAARAKAYASRLYPRIDWKSGGAPGEWHGYTIPATEEENAFYISVTPWRVQ